MGLGILSGAEITFNFNYAKSVGLFFFGFVSFCCLQQAEGPASLLFRSSNSSVWEVWGHQECGFSAREECGSEAVFV